MILQQEKYLILNKPKTEILIMQILKILLRIINNKSLNKKGRNLESKTLLLNKRRKEEQQMKINLK